ncbi:glycosyltransferase [Novosphingobium percolationis]|uniref:glycosyltransferase n=1 Tax=Novosphingobium percolationis TaxID=2871811 RepID=UPI001CD29C5C|nr:glycosyltransferase [Novosphingobium percolationis]
MTDTLPDSDTRSHPIPADRISELYRGEVASDEASEVARERIHWMCSHARGETVLDIGCSQGIAAILLAREGFVVTGVDAHPDAIAYATEATMREAAAVAARLTWLQRDLYELPQDLLADTVVLGEVIEHQAVPERFLLAARRHLAPGGTIVLTTPFGLHPHEDHKATLLPRDVVRMAEAIGLAVDEIDVVDGYIRMIARDGEKAPRNDEDLLRVTSSGALAAQERHYALMAKRGAALEARTREIAKHTATIASLRGGSDAQKKALAELETELAKARRQLAETRAADERAIAELTANGERLRGDLAKARKTGEDLAERLEVHRDKLTARLDAMREELGGKLEAARDTLVRVRGKLSEKLEAAREELKLARETNERLAANVARAEADLTQSHAETAAARAELAETQAARAGLEDHIDDLTRLVATLRENLATQDAAYLRKREEQRKRIADANAERKALQKRLATREAELTAALAEAQAQLQHERRAALVQQRGHQRVQAAYERQAAALKQTVGFQLGDLLVKGFRSPGAIAKLPGQLIALRREDVKRKRTRGAKLVAALGGKDFSRLIERFEAEGYDAAVAMIEALDLVPVARANAYTALARHLQAGDPARCAQAARIAQDADPQPWRAKWLAFRLFDAGELLEPARLLRELPDDNALSASEEARSAQIHALADLFELKPDLPITPSTRYSPKPRSLLYVAASAMPYHISGYTTRTAALLSAIAASGVELTAATRPGYPWDRPDTKGAARETRTLVDGVEYRHFRQPAQSLPLDVYLERAAAAIARLAVEKRVGAIQAASNHVNALPALIAARQVGVPFHYEMRGLWEMSRASNVEGFEESERYRLGLDLEAFAARQADRVYAISQPLAEFLTREWGIARNRIAVLPNGIDSAAFAAISPSRPARFTIGYAGALVGYEGLDLLLDAIAALRGEGKDIALSLIGDGAAREALEAQAQALGLGSAVEFAGKLAPAQARARIAQMSLVCLPRRPDKVCELVPPIKLVEAMALGVPLVVPDLAAFRSEAEDGVTARFFRAGDGADLARAIAAVFDDPASAAAMAETARTRALEQRDWGAAAALVLSNLGGPREDSAGKTGTQDRSPEQEAPGALSLTGLLLDPQRTTDFVAREGAAGIVALIDKERTLSGKARALELIRVGRTLSDAGLSAADVALADEALATDRSVAVLISAYGAFERAGVFERTAAILAELNAHPHVIANQNDRQRVEKLKGGLAHQLSMLDLIEESRERAFEPVGNRICYMLHNSLPYSSGGYATRTHGVATGLRDNGFDVVAMTRPGFPHDVVTGLEGQDVPQVDVIDGIPYRRTFEPRRSALKYVNYVPEAARVLEEQYRELRPAMVMSASNHVVALPALIACRRLGIPFVYEVRGFWEVTKMSREDDYGETAAYKLQSLLEAAVCKAADHVFTLTEPMREELAERGVDAGLIDILPNSCDPERFLPRARDGQLAAELGIPDGTPVIGYVGTFVDYEGLEDLARACGLLKQRGQDFRLLLVGNENTSGNDTGPITQMIAEAADESGFSDWLIMPGRVPHEVVGRYYSLLDVCPFPRKPWPVCEMVSPMKPLEALAMEKAVVVSSVRALVEMIADGKTGLVFEKGNIESLADTLQHAMTSPDLRAELGRNGRAWVQDARTWRAVGAKAAGLLADYVTPVAPDVELAQ